nr:MAG TPA: hypothetical protein [Caudoviricetes sp.]
MVYNKRITTIAFTHIITKPSTRLVRVLFYLC